MARSKFSNKKLPSAAELKRILLTLRHVGLDIRSIDMRPNQIIVMTTSADASLAEELSAFDIWKMETDQEPASRPRTESDLNE